MRLGWIENLGERGWGGWDGKGGEEEGELGARSWKMEDREWEMSITIEYVK